MRRFLLTTSCLIVLLTAAASRVSADDGASRGEAPRVTVGGFWSANAATISYRPTPIDIASRQWIGAGATVDVPVGDCFSVDARAMWNRKGATLTLASGGAASQDVRADYLSVPILFKVSSRGPVRAYAVAGPEASLRLASRVVTTLGAARFDENANDVTERFDIAADAGAGIERSMGRSSLFVEGLYSYGLKNVVKPTTPGEQARTRTLTLLAGIRF
jgi:Outer membrane protein beta-barrel domain